MSELSPYNGIQVVVPDPIGEGGLAINDNFKKLSTKLATADPGSGDNSTEGYGVGSRWVNTATQEEFVCTDAGTSAVWLKIAPRFSVATSTVSGGGTVSVDASTQDTVDIDASGNFTIANPSNSANGRKLTFRIRNTSGGNISVSFDTNFRFGTDLTSPLPAITAGKVMKVHAQYTTQGSVTKWDVDAYVGGF